MMRGRSGLYGFLQDCLNFEIAAVQQGPVFIGALPERLFCNMLPDIQRRGGGWRWRIADIDDSFMSQDHEVVQQLSVKSQRLGSHTGRRGF